MTLQGRSDVPARAIGHLVVLVAVCLSAGRPLGAAPVVLPGTWFDVDKYHLATEPHSGASWTHGWYGDDTEDPFRLGIFQSGEPYGEVSDPDWPPRYIPTYVGDGSCWIATSANMIQYMGKPNYYHDWAYVTGIDGDSDYAYDFWPEGGRVLEALENEGYMVLMRTSDDVWGADPNVEWENDPIPFCERRLSLGLPVGLSIKWLNGGRHAFTMYGIDTQAQTITFACSDSDQGGVEFLTRPYTWANSKWRVDYYGDGNYHHLIGATSFSCQEWMRLYEPGDWSEKVNWEQWGREEMYWSLPGPKSVVLIEYVEGYPGHVEVTTVAQAMKCIVSGAQTQLWVRPGGRLDCDSFHTRIGGRARIEGGVIAAAGPLLDDGQVVIELGGSLTCLDAFVGGVGSGALRATGGGSLQVANNLTLGQHPGSAGSLVIDGSGGGGAVTVNFDEYVGDAGAGTVEQTGGSHQVQLGGLYLGLKPGAAGQYTLSGGSLQARYLCVAYQGHGEFTHEGGSVTVTDTLYLGGAPGGGQGNYTMTGGTLLTGSLRSGYGGGSLFVQTHGEVRVTDLLEVGGEQEGVGGAGIYTLGGNALLETNDLTLGNGGAGVFNQTSNSTCVVWDRLTLGGQAGGTATYNLTNGLLDNSGGWGILIGGDSPGTLNLNDGTVSAPMVLLGSNAEGVVRQTGGQMIVQGTLAVGFAEAGSGQYTMDAGTLNVQQLGVGTSKSQGVFTLNGGTLLADKLLRGPGGQCPFQGGTVRVNQLEGVGGLMQFGGTLQIGYDEWSAAGSYTHPDGDLRVDRDLVIGFDAPATVTHTGGRIVTKQALTLGLWGGGTAKYHFGAGAAPDAAFLVAQSLNVGFLAEATFDQQGGTVDVAGTTIVGAADGGHGTYHLRGGVLSTDTLKIGNDNGGTGQFNWSGGGLVARRVHLYAGSDMTSDQNWSVTEELVLEGGELQINGHTLYVGNSAGDSASLHVMDGYAEIGGLLVGRWGAGSYQQDLGLVKVYNDFQVAAGVGGQGDCTISGGEAEVQGSMEVGSAGTGTVRQSGGMMRVLGDLFLGRYAEGDGTYELSGGALAIHGVLYVGGDGEARFVHSGGTYSAAEVEVGPLGSLETPAETLVFTEKVTLKGGKVVLDSRDLVFDGVRAVARMEAGSRIASKTQCYGDQGRGVMYQDGGTNTLSSRMVLGRTPTACGEYHLGGRAVLESLDLTVGHEGTGVMYQTAGTHRVSGDLVLGSQPRSHGEYVISGGELVVGNLRIGDQGGGRWQVTDPAASVTVEQSICFGPHGEYVATAGTTIHMTGSHFYNESQDPKALAGLSHTTLVFEGGPGIFDTFEVAGWNFGAATRGLNVNFALAALIVGGDAGVGHLRLRDEFDNQPWFDGFEALYVQHLVVGPGSTLDLNGLDLYYGDLTLAKDAGIRTNGGTLAAVPAPTSGLLLAAGGAALLRRRRSRTAA